ncbi:hypothetical protein PoB_006054100 [Plakobranchus ocellatus]|uniref:G-protein coupled receptors family 1 profile domain-containing protein n=1 Tax=Plakobranchus ocellatus TaxID=259542 RepID=A0AAV4CQF1_9GAST|nr:hypothetical protein PoB_006054100 [Plakobranchus ocellatus]
MDLGFDRYSNTTNHTNLLGVILFECSFIVKNMTTCSTLQSPDKIDTIRSICRVKDIVIDVEVWCIVVPALVGNGLVIFTIRFLYKASPQQGDLRLSGPTSGQGAGDGARTRDRKVPADLSGDSLALIPRDS